MEKTEWIQQDGESAKAFEAFTVYRDLGADRSIRAAAEEVGKDKSLLERWSKEYRWQERVKAWDMYLQEKEIEAVTDALSAMYQRQVALAGRLFDLVNQALDNIGPKLVTEKNFTSVIKCAADLERSARMAIQNQENAALKKQKAQQDDEFTKSLNELLHLSNSCICD